MSYLPFHPTPKKPEHSLPAGSCDAHCHVFGPAAQFPFAPARKYTPCDAPKSKLFELHDRLGIERSVIVQASCHGSDNSAMIDALKEREGRYRGVAVVDGSLSSKEIAAMHEAGVRGVRFNFLPRLVDAKDDAYYRDIAKLISAFGWHVVVYYEGDYLSKIYDLLLNLPTPLVIDHMGRPDVTQDLQQPAFTLSQQLMGEREDVWVKVSCMERLSSQPPHYPDVVPFARHLVENFSDKVLWGTDWPHPNMSSHMPDDGVLVDNLWSIATTETLRQKLLVDNPARLYDFS